MCVCVCVCVCVRVCVRPIAARAAISRLLISFLSVQKNDVWEGERARAVHQGGGAGT
uniref:Uncharacterized protein n=1 Tax=Anguilla anguilla TaxID=7936 RepID=A0A0E9SQI0_ANGAN